MFNPRYWYQVYQVSLYGIEKSTFDSTSFHMIFYRFGFSGEPSPRCIIPTETTSGDTGKLIRVFEYEDTNQLRTNLVDFIHTLFFKSVLEGNNTLVSIDYNDCFFIIRHFLTDMLLSIRKKRELWSSNRCSVLAKYEILWRRCCSIILRYCLFWNLLLN